MKLKMFFALFALLALNVQCGKQEETKLSPEVRLLEQEHSAKMAKTNGPEISWMLYCEGDCTECKGKGVKIRNLVYECPCTDQCSLKIVRVGDNPSLGGKDAIVAKAQVDSLTKQYGTFQNDLIASMAKRYAVSDFRITAVEVYAESQSFALKYHIESDDLEFPVSLSYLRKGEEPGYEVDCNGDCISASAKCTERIILGTPIQIECTCEGDCKMDVTPTRE